MPLTKYEHHVNWVKKYPEKRRAQKRRYYEKHGDRIRARERARYFEQGINVSRTEYYKQFPEKQKERWLKTTYGITFEDFSELLKKQNGRCAICGDDGKLQVDHDHATEKVRALLCGHCNKLLGHAKDNQKVLEAAIEYLKHHEVICVASN